MTTQHQPNTVVIVDLDDTLIPDQTAFREAAQTVLATHPTNRHRLVEANRDPVDELLERARQRWRTSPLRRTPAALGVSSWEALWSDLDHKDSKTAPVATAHAITVWRDTLTAIGADPRRARQAAQMLIERREVLTRPFPGARDVIEQLAAGNRLWLVTHGSSSLQRRKLHLAGLEQYLDLIFISAEVGLLKDTTEFTALLKQGIQRSGLSIRAVIGDSTSDLTLAQNGGWPTIHICAAVPCHVVRANVEHHHGFARLRDADWLTSST